jgi:ABC-type antimicrobial peptide transport system permease subunit
MVNSVKSEARPGLSFASVYRRIRTAALMRINIWIVLAVLLALLAITRLSQYQHETQRICADDPTASVCSR